MAAKSSSANRAGRYQKPQWLDTLDSNDKVPYWLEVVKDENEIANIHGALIELGKWVPTAGLVMIQIYFPSSLRCHDDSIRDNRHKKFWETSILI